MAANRGPMDYISNLPNSILCEIFKRFTSTRYIARTSVLSKRWKNFWIEMQTFDYDDSSLGPFKIGDDDRIRREFRFMNLVDKSLYYSTNKLKRFRLKRVFPKLDYDFHLVNTWIGVAVKRNVEEMELECSRNDLTVSLPKMLFDSKNLVVLKLHGDILLEIPDSVSLPNLKLLHLDSIEYKNNDSARKLFAACPVLEKLVVTRAAYDNVQVMNVCAPRLRSLQVIFHLGNRRSIHTSDSEDDDFPAGSRGLNVVCPQLEEFHLEDFMSANFSLSNVSSLSKAHINVGSPSDVRNSFEHSTSELLCGIKEVRFLSFPTRMMKYLAYGYGRELPMFSNLTHLELGAVDVVCWEKAFCFLENSPQLEVLIIQKAANEPFHVGIDDWDPPAQVPICLSMYLKEIKILKFRGLELEVLGYILRHAQVLNLMTVECKRLLPAAVHQIKEQLEVLYAQKASETCRLIFNGIDL